MSFGSIASWSREATVCLVALTPLWWIFICLGIEFSKNCCSIQPLLLFHSVDLTFMVNVCMDEKCLITDMISWPVKIVINDPYLFLLWVGQPLCSRLKCWFVAIRFCIKMNLTDFSSNTTMWHFCFLVKCQIIFGADIHSAQKNLII